MRSVVTCTSILFSLSVSAFASDVSDNWPQWRGPNFNGSSDTGNPPVEWSETKNVRWKIEVPGKGSATPIIWENRIYVLTAIPTDRKAEGAAAAAAEPPADQQQGRGGRGGRGGFGAAPPPTNFHQYAVICYDRTTGGEVWRTVAVEAVPHEGGHGTNTFASGSPVTDGKHLFVSFGSRGVFCFDMNGKEVWHRDLGQMQTRNSFGEGSSPALHGDTLVIPWDHEGQSSLIALDATNGEIRWQVERDERTTWATPFIVEHNGRTQVVTNGHRVRSYDLETGDLVWECGGQVENPIPSPVLQDNMIVCMTGYRGNAIYAIPLDATDDVTDTDVVAWKRDDAAPYVASPVLYKGQLYFTKSREGIMSSVDAATGEVLIGQQRLPEISSVYASPVAAADRVYFPGREGATA
ncbi:MAG: PQQ-binding-like beta-propeller repeat protein, partial [Planctomycetaceae bacterium]